MPPGGAFQTLAQQPASASVPEETDSQVKGMGLECQSWPCYLYQETLAPPSLIGPQPLGLTQGFAKQVSHNHGQASTHSQAYMQGLKTRASAKECFQGQLESSSAQGLSACQLRARNPSNRQHLSTPWQSKKLPTRLKDVQHFIFLFPGGSQPGEWGTGTRDHTAGVSGRMKGRPWKGLGTFLGGQSEGRVRAEEQIQYQRS